MGIEWVPLLHRGLLVLAGLAGFQGIAREASPAQKALSWMVLQASLVLLGLSMAQRPEIPGTVPPPLNPLTHALAFSLFLVSLGILSVLLVLARGTRRRGALAGGTADSNPKRKAK